MIATIIISKSKTEFLFLKECTWHRICFHFILHTTDYAVIIFKIVKLLWYSCSFHMISLDVIESLREMWKTVKQEEMISLYPSIPICRKIPLKWNAQGINFTIEFKIDFSEFWGPLHRKRFLQTPSPLQKNSASSELWHFHC